jgi:HD superfamily phosphohydrolase
VAAGKPDWEQIRAEYVAGGTSYRKLCEKYDISFGTLQDRARKEKWFENKKKMHEKTMNKTIQKIASRKASRIIKELDPALLAAEKINQLVLDTLMDDKQFKRHLVQTKERKGNKSSFTEVWDVEEREFNVVDTKRLRDLAAALKISKELQRLLQGLVDPNTAAKIRVEEERLELEKKKVERELTAGEEVFTIVDPFEEQQQEQQGGDET